MPFKLKNKLIKWLKQRSPESKIEQLSKTIDEVNELIDGREDALSNLVRQHITLAEEDCNAAISKSQLDTKTSLKLIEFALFRLELAKQQLRSESTGEYQANFAQGTTEFRALILSSAIIKTKMAIEFSNCVVSEDNKQQLIHVTKMFNEATKQLKSNNRERSKSTAEGGLLLLYRLTRELEVANHETIVELDEFLKHCSDEFKAIKEALTTVYDLRITCHHYPSQVNKQILEQIEESTKSLQLAIDAHFKKQNEIAEGLINESLAQIGKAARQLKSAATKHNVIAAEFAEDSTVSRVRQFKNLAFQLQRLVTNRAAQADLALRRLEASLEYYLAAAKAYKQAAAVDGVERAKLAEKAEKLARSARIDLVFTRNLLFSEEKLPSQDLIERMQKLSDRISE